MSVDADTYMPEFWPADRILGLILDEQIEGVDAGKIVGLIVSDQVASLAAAKIEGKLTQEQIETIAAEQITGKLTDEQIAEIAAAKIVGQLTDSQLGGISAAKIIGEIASGQISGVDASKIIGQLTNAQIKTLEAAKVTGQLTNAQLAGLASAKIEGLLTSEQIENLAVAKLVGQISESQIAAKAVTAGKINVAELSAISVNAGLIEAGIFRGVTFETSGGDTSLTNEGLGITAPKVGGVKNVNRIQWFKEKLKNQVSEIISYISESGGTYFFRILTNSPTEAGATQILLDATHLKGLAMLFVEATNAVRKVYVTVQEVTRVIFDSAGKSDFLQLTETAKRKINRGKVVITFPGASKVADSAKINHELGELPASIVATNSSGTGLWQITVDVIEETATQFKLRATFNTGFEPAAGTKVTCNWIGMT